MNIQIILPYNNETKNITFFSNLYNLLNLNYKYKSGRMKTLRKTLLISLIVSIYSISFAQIEKHAKWDFSSKRINDNEVELIFKAQIDKGWHLYSPYNPPGASRPLEINFDQSDKFTKKGKIKESPKPTEKYEEIFDVTEKYFELQATFKQVITVKSTENFKVTGLLEGQVCFEDGMCIGFEEPFEINIKGVTNNTKEKDEETENIEQDTSNNKTETIIDSVANNDTTTADSKTVNKDSIIKQTDFSMTDPGVLNKNKSLWSIFFISMLAGLVAIFTPCVFPMIPMTVSFFMKDSANKLKNRFQATAYGISIVAIYTLPIALLILISTLFGAGTVTADIFNWMSTHWLPNILFFLIFLIFAASFLGMFEIVLPNWMISKADSKADKGGLMGVFFMAFVLVLVSFSCTGPIVGAVLVESSSGGQIIEPIVSMLGFSLAFAFPFTFFAFFPRLLNNLPKSGGWLNTVKVVLGFIELALGLKFLSVADQTYHWGILDREIYIALWIVIFTLMGLYLLGKLKFANDSNIPYIKVPRLMFAILTFSFVVYLIPGMFGAPLKTLSGYLPPQTTHDFDMRQIVRDVVKEYSLGDGTVQSNNKNELCDKAKYSNFLHLPHGLEGYFDYEQGIACAKKLNKPVFIDFTGHGCVNCRKMEENVWIDPDVIKRLKEDYLIIALYVDDKTTLPEEEWIVSEFDGRTKKTIGKKFADFQISKYGVNAQPYYVLLDPHNDTTPLIAPRAYNLNVQGFVEFLDKGIEEFNKRHKK